MSTPAPLPADPPCDLCGAAAVLNGVCRRCGAAQAPAPAAVAPRHTDGDPHSGGVTPVTSVTSEEEAPLRRRLESWSGSQLLAADTELRRRLESWSGSQLLAADTELRRRVRQASWDVCAALVRRALAGSLSFAELERRRAS